MSNTKHTPGPWCRAHGLPQIIMGGYPKFNICKMEIAATEADARLIAAAPDLLEVCEAMANFDGRNNNSALKDMARAAIAKAKGE